MNPEKLENQQPTQENYFIEIPIQPKQKIEQVDALKSIETVDESKVLEKYEENNFAIQEEIIQTKQNRDSLVQQVTLVRKDLYGENIPVNVDTPSIDAMDTKLQALRLEQIKTSSNYPGDWTLLLRDRMLDPITKEKFIETREATMPNMKQEQIPQKSGDGISYIKESDYKEYYQKQIDIYDETVQRIFNSTHVEESSEYNKKPENLGKGEIGFPGVVFSDAIKDGRELTLREKNIIESHEKGHGLRDFVSSDQQDFRQSIDMDVIRQNDSETGIRQIGYLRTADEIAERMAQLKNYFGMKAEDIFTKDHLKYAADNYITDTSLDNNMTVFFKAITERTADKFMDTINKYPL